MDALARAADLRPDAPALVAGERTIPFAELDAAASGVADLILSSGTFGDHPVAFWGERTPEAVAAAWGITRAGVAAVPVDPRLPPAAAMEATRSAGVRGLWAPPDDGIDRLVARHAARPEREPGGFVVMTSGSEGAPKGVVITAENVAASVRASRARLGNGPDDAWLCVLPLFHVGGLAILWRQAETAAPVILHERFDADRVAGALADVGLASFVPVMLRRVLAAGGRGHRGLRAVLVGGAAAEEGLLRSAREADLPALPTYGMTETSSQIATPAPGDPLDGTVGPPLDGAEIRVLRDGGTVVGEEGRIEVRGPMVSPGYVGEAERTSEWLTTGDVGVMTAEGRLRVLGRADVVIVTGGENVHPAAVEAALRRLEPVRDARVFGVPDDEWGMAVAAEVETTATPAELDEAARSLPPSWRPRRWEIVERVRRKLE